MPHPSLKGERGTVIKEWRGRASVALVYPNRYRVGMANLGVHAIYGAFNAHSRVVCERVFLPDREGARPLSVESSRPLTDFDLIAVSFSTETDYINALKMMRAAGLPVRSTDRGGDLPPVLAGGVPVTLNHVPLAPFLDAVFIGEGEEAVPEVCEALLSSRSRGKDAVLSALQGVPGIYLPSLGEGIRPARRWPASIDAWPVRTIISTPRAGLGGMRLVEITRGCRWKCRFCTAAFGYLPPRERSLASLRPVLAEDCSLKTGLVSAMVSDHSEIRGILRAADDMGLRVSASSLRASASSEEIIRALARNGHKTLTIGPETGTERLRYAVNKPLSDRDILDTVRIAADAGIPSLKLYFMVGLPTERREDIEAIPDLVGRVRGAFPAGPGRGRITVTLSPFIPKAWTPLQWAAYRGDETLRDWGADIGKRLSAARGVEARVEGGASAAVSAYLSRGGAEAAEALDEALTGGWKEVLRGLGGAPFRERGLEEEFPWDFVDMGIEKRFLVNEYRRALRGRITPACDVTSCTACGVCRPPGVTAAAAG